MADESKIDDVTPKELADIAAGMSAESICLTGLVVIGGTLLEKLEEFGYAGTPAYEQVHGAVALCGAKLWLLGIPDSKGPIPPKKKG